MKDYYPGADEPPYAKTRTFPGEDRPRISSRELARKLGMNHEELCQLIEQHREQLEPAWTDLPNTNRRPGGSEVSVEKTKKVASRDARPRGAR
jgi:hypothetical protein